MGYTHYWTQLRNFTTDEWAEVVTDITEILTYTENLAGIPLANGMGDAGTRPTFGEDKLQFNGVGDDSHETFGIGRKRVKTWEGAQLGADFCKTAEKPYDVAVTACLCYLSSCFDPPAFSVTSDGKGRDFSAGLDLARQALPRKANVLDIPIDVMKKDRWTGPWIRGTPPGYEVNFCVDGRGYVLHKRESYCFETHADLGRFLLAHQRATFPRGGRTSFGTYERTEENIWNASGSFDEARHARIARAQRKVLASLFPVDLAHNRQPPAFVRPGDLPRPEDAPPFHYSLSDLIAAVDKA